jgi:dTDP-4-dehydrorhamnose 3,5-epimerase
VPIAPNRDSRGCLNEIFRQTWPGAFPAVQWNACVSEAQVVRGAHVHVDYSEFYTLPQGQVVLALADIRKSSPSFRKTTHFEWSDSDGQAVAIPPGVAHVVFFQRPSVLVFGLSDFWKQEYDNLGCQWNAPELGVSWSLADPKRSERDCHSGSFSDMIEAFESLSAVWNEEKHGARSKEDVTVC